MANEAEFFSEEAALGHLGRIEQEWLDWIAMLTGEVEMPEWLVEPVLAAGRGHALYAPAKAGKSLLALALAAGVATGRPILGRPASEPVPVVYLDLEMTQEDVKTRVLDMGYQDPYELSKLYYYLLPSIPPLDTREGGDVLVELATKQEAQLVVIDTTGRAVAGGENDADTYLNFYRHTGRRLKAMGCTYLRTDHAGKDYGRGQRGTSAKNDDVDVVWSLEPRDKPGDTRPYLLTATHRRMGFVPPEVALNLCNADDQWMEWQLANNGLDAGYPAGTKRVIDALDQLQLPDAVSNRDARTALKAAGLTAKGTLLAAAIRFRRERAL